MAPPLLRTRFTEEFGVALPIMCGGMHYVGYAELTAAVSNAGALGFITAVTQPNPEALRAEIRKCRALTDKPFGCNISFLPAATPPDYEAYINVMVQEGIPVVETAGNNPGKYIEMIKRGGCKVIHKCTTIKHAETAARFGADWISIDGYECAGHPGMDDVGGLLLLALAAKKLGNLPYIASGGIGTGIQLAACLALGAEGINMGTRFMCVQEAVHVHDNIKRALVEAEHTQTMTILRSLRNTERVFKNAEALKAAEAERKAPGDIAVVREFIAGSKYRKSFHETGNTEDSVWSCGQVIGLIDDVPTCQELMDRIMHEAVHTIDTRLASMRPRL